MRAGAALLGAAFAVAMGGAAAQVALPDPFVGAAAGYVVVADGAPLWAGNDAAPLPPASLTKLMTALLVVEAAADADVVTVSARAARSGGARMGLGRGVQLRVHDLLAGLLMRSGNDACVALAEHVDGSEARFVARMNARAATWGLAATRFANACGFDAPGHVSSARDIAALAARVVAQPRLAVHVATRQRTVQDLAGGAYKLASTNALLGLVPGLAGVKTGYTAQAGHCLAAFARRDDRVVLVVLLRGRDRWWDAVAMIEQAFAQPRLAPR